MLENSFAMFERIQEKMSNDINRFNEFEKETNKVEVLL